MKHVRFFATDPTTGRVRQLSPWTRDIKLLVATRVTLRLENQKNGWKNVCVHQEVNGHEFACPVKALVAGMIEIRSNTLDRIVTLSAYWENGERKDVTDEDIQRAVKTAAEVLDYLYMRDIEIDQVNTHSLRGGGVNALHCAGFSDHQTTKIRRWRSSPRHSSSALSRSSATSPRGCRRG